MKHVFMCGLLFQSAVVVASPSLSRDVPCDFSEGADKTEYLFAEIGPNGGNNWNMRCGKDGFNEWSHVRPGKMTVMFGPWLAERPQGKATLKFFCNCTGEQQDVKDFRAVGAHEPDAVYFAGKHADGTRLQPGDTVRTGDTLAIRMRVVAPPDDLALTFYTVNRSPDWTKKGRWELLEIPGVPNSLQPTKSDPLVYGCVFKVPQLPQAVKLTPQSLVASVNYTGADSRQYGICYGFAPYAFEFEGGATSMQNGNYRFYDFGPVDGPVQAGAMRVTPQDTPAGFKWLSGPGGYYAAFARTLDASMADWAVVHAKRPMSFQISLPSNRTYRVLAGICSIGAKCYNNFMFMPYQGKLTANGKTLWCRTPEEAKGDCYKYIDREAQVGEDLYETYVKPYLHDVGAEVEVGDDGLLKVEYSLFPNGVQGAPLNYLVVYPKGNAACDKTYRKQLANRRERFYEFWRDVTDGNWDFTNPLQATPDQMGKGPLRLFARENAGYWVLPQMRPLLTELDRPLLVTAAPGQLIAGTALLNPTRDAPGVTVSLKGDFPAGVKADLYRQMHYRYAHTYTHVHRLGVNHLMPIAPRFCRANASYGFAVRFDVAEDARPGVYRGTLVATDSLGATASLPVELRVLDVKLPELSDHRIAMLGGMSGTEYGMKTAMRELGCTTASITLTGGHYGHYKVDEKGVCVETPASPAKLDARFKSYDRIGFPCKEPFVSIGGQGYNDPEACGPYKPFTPEWRACIRRFYGDIYVAARSNGLDNVVFDTGGEMGHDAKIPKEKTMQDAIRYFNVIHELVPGAKVSYRCNCWATVQNFFPVLDVAGVRGHASWQKCDSLPSDVRAKKDYYTYSVEGRFLNGVHSWSHGAKGNFREWLNWDHTCNYDDFLCQGDCGGNGHNQMMPGPDATLVTTVHTESFRASVDDRKYLRLLDNAIAAAKDGPEKDNALAFEALVRKVIEDAMLDHTQPFGYWTSYRHDANCPWPALNLDLMREVCYRFSKSLASGRPSGLPPFKTPERKSFEFGLEDGPLVREGTAAATVVLSMKPDKGETVRKAVAEIRDAADHVVRTVDLGDTAQNRRVVVPMSDLKSGAFVATLKLDGKPEAECPFVVLAAE